MNWVLLLAVVVSTQVNAAAPCKVVVDATTTPDHAAWARSAESFANEWTPRLINLLGAPRSAPETIKISISRDYHGVAYAAAGAITLSNDWVTNQPDDSRGVVIHELVHVVQGYPHGNESWIIEGIADYLRFAIYEAKPLTWFPRPQKDKGYFDSYRVAAGFLFWLESDPAPGIVRRLNSALRDGTYDVMLFEKSAGKPLDALWHDYVTKNLDPKK